MVPKNLYRNGFYEVLKKDGKRHFGLADFFPHMGK